MANISLTKEQEKFIRDQVKSGRYISASEVVRESLRKLEMEELFRQQELIALQTAIAVGDAAIEQGKTVSSDTVFRRAREILKKHKRNKVTP